MDSHPIYECKIPERRYCNLSNIISVGSQCHSDHNNFTPALCNSSRQQPPGIISNEDTHLLHQASVPGIPGWQTLPGVPGWAGNAYGYPYLPQQAGLPGIPGWPTLPGIPGWVWGSLWTSPLLATASRPSWNSRLVNPSRNSWLGWDGDTCQKHVITHSNTW